MRIVRNCLSVKAPKPIEQRLNCLGLEAGANPDVPAPGLSDNEWNALATYSPLADGEGCQAVHLTERIALCSPLFAADPKGRAVAYVERFGESLFTDKMSDVADRRVLLNELVQNTRSPTSSRQAEEADKLIQLFEQSGKCCRDASREVELQGFEEVRVVGDLHGDLQSLQRISQAIEGDFRGRRAAVVFLGDYPNNGFQSIAVLKDVLIRHCTEPNRIFPLAGNHETAEGFATALKEMLVTHWGHAILEPSPRYPPAHCYGHLLLDAIRDFGYDSGMQVYGAFAAWAAKLPCVARFGSTLLSHSLGLPSGVEALREAALGFDARDLGCWGYEEWKRRKSSVRSAMLNNRDFTEPGLVERLKRAFRADRFIVGHSHYRSGTVLPNLVSDIVTISSFDSNSPDAGHYGIWEYEVQRRKKGPLQGIGPGPARPVHGKLDGNGAFAFVPV